ncbi:MAG TPA: ATP-binding protein, partial [Patescibacteria group bacterium]
RDFTVDFSGVKTDVISSLIDNLPTYAFIVLLLMNLLWDLTMLGMIVARKRAQRAADLATKDLIKFKQAVDGVSDLVIITDPDAKILYANNASKKITGYDKKEIIGKNPSLWGKRMDTDFYEHFWKTLKVDKKVFNGEVTNKRKNGEVYEAELSVWPILGEKKELIYLVGIERDISKTKAVERMKTEFISLASHQLRTPLSAVKWFGKMLADGEAGPLSKTQAEYLNKINESNEREIQLVNSLLNVSRIESGKIKLLPKPTDIRSLVEATVSDVRVGLNNKKRKILVDMPKDIPLVEVDPDLMRHVYMNLLMNAVNYSDENDSIKIDISLKDGEMITKISDTGIGIPAAEKTRIFEKFFRGSNALKKETDGSGLGLYLTKTIIESSGGKIWFESKENMGTTFWFTIPIESGKMI